MEITEPKNKKNWFKSTEDDEGSSVEVGEELQREAC